MAETVLRTELTLSASEEVGHGLDRSPAARLLPADEAAARHIDHLLAAREEARRGRFYARERALTEELIDFVFGPEAA